MSPETTLGSVMGSELVPGMLQPLYFALLHCSPPDDWGPGAVPAIALLSLLNLVWTPHQTPRSLLSESYMLFI